VCWVLGRCLKGAGDVGSQGVEVGERGVGMGVCWFVMEGVEGGYRNYYGRSGALGRMMILCVGLFSC